MKKYKIERSYSVSQNQIVEAKNKEEALEIAEENEENFENTMNSDTEWQYPYKVIEL